jgi:hypothetical protein
MKHHLLKFLTLLLALAATTTGLAYAQQQQPPPDTVVVRLIRLDSLLGNPVNTEPFPSLYALFPRESNTARVISDSAGLALIRSNYNNKPAFDSLLIDHYLVAWSAEVGIGGGESWFEFYAKMIPSQSKTILHCDAVQECDFYSDGSVLCGMGLQFNDSFLIIRKEFLLNFVQSSYFNKHVPNIK